MKKILALIVIAVMLWSPIPWLYFDLPESLVGQPLSFYAVMLFLGGLSMLALAVLMTLSERLSVAKARAWTFLLVLAGIIGYQFSGFAPNWDCLGKQFYASVVYAQSGCTTICTNSKLKPCSGWSTCWGKFVSCNSAGIDQDGRPCQGCCFSCTIICPTSEPPPASTSTPTLTPTVTPTTTIAATPTVTPTPTFTPTFMPTNTPSPTPTPLFPTITAQVICDLWGDAGWCRGNEILELTARDSQGFDLSISGDLNGVPFTCGSSCSVPLPEGMGMANYTALSTSGRSASGSSAWQRDGTPPVLNLIVPPVDGRNGWYVSEVDVSASAMDTASGLSSLMGSTDEGATWISFPIHFTDGVHPIFAYARDVAGNEVTVSEVLHVDAIPPVAQFTSHLNGEVVQGNVLLEGRLDDGMSGPAGGKLSLDGGTTWQTVTMDNSDAWSLRWETNDVPNGQYTLLMRGWDRAGNIGEPASIILAVDNDPPRVSISRRWWIWESGQLKISPNYFPIASVKVTIRDSQNRWPAQVLNFNPGKVPYSISWDRRFADGTLAPSGEYPVEVVACDIHNLCGRDTGMIVIPIATTSSVTVTPSPTPTRTTTPQATITPTQKPVTPTLALVTPVPETPSMPPQTGRSIPLWQILGFLGLLLVIASANVVDPRPAALNRLRKSIQLISAQNIMNTSEEEQKKNRKDFGRWK